MLNELAKTVWPEHHEELGRKTSEQIAKWSAAYSAGSITKREFYITIAALYDTTSGLIPRDVSELLAQIHSELRDQSERNNTMKIL